MYFAVILVITNILFFLQKIESQIISPDKPYLCTPPGIIFGDIPTCPNSTMTYPHNVTVVFDTHGRMHIPDMLIESEDQFVESKDGLVYCFDTASILDYDCTYKVNSGFPASPASPICGEYKCSADSNCFCKQGGVKSSFTAHANDLTFETSRVETRLIRVAVPKIQVLPHSRRLLDTQTIFVELYREVLRLTFTVEGTHAVMIRKDTYSRLYMTQNKTLTILLPEELFVVSGALEITVHQDGVIVFADSVYLVGTTICRLKDCTFCVDAIDNFRCLTTKVQIVIVLVIISGIAIVCMYTWRPVKALITALVNVLWFMIACVFFCLRPSHRPRIISNVIDAVKKYTRKVKYYLEPEDSDARAPSESVPLDEEGESEDSEPENSVAPFVPPPPARPVRKNQKSRRPGSASVGNLAVIIVFLGLLSAVFGHRGLTLEQLLDNKGIAHNGDILSSCHDGLTLSGNQVNCISINATFETCSTSLSIRATLPYALTALCLTLKDADGNAVGKIVVGYLAMEVVVENEHLYETSDTTLHTQTVQHCHNPFYETICPNACHMNTDRTAAGTITDPLVTTYSGRSGCYKGCGSLACGCALSFDSCVSFGWSLIGSANYYTVKRNTNHYSRPIAFIGVLAGNIVVDFAYVDGFDFKNVSNIFVAFDTISGFNDVNLDGLKLIQTWDGRNYLGAANEVNVPLFGQLGDIQVNTPSQLITPTQAMRIAPDLVSQDLFGTHASFAKKMSGAAFFEADTSKVLLPGMFRGEPYDFINNKIQVNLTRTPSIAFGLRTNGTYTFTREKLVVCPSGVHWVSSGFYSSSRGSTTILNLTSTCATGLALVTISDGTVDLWTHSVYLIPLLVQSISINYNPPVSKVKFILTVKGTTTSLSFPIEFAARPDPRVQQDNSTAPADSPSGTVEDFFNGVVNWFDNFFLGNSGIISALIIAAIITSVVVLGLLIIGSSLAAIFVFVVPSVATGLPAIAALSALFSPKTKTA